MIFVTKNPKYPDVKKWFDACFTEWARTVDREDRTVTNFADWLGEERPLVSHWINGLRRPSFESAKRVSNKLGAGVYALVENFPPDPGLQLIIRNWDKLPESFKQQLLQEIEQYENRGGESPFANERI